MTPIRVPDGVLIDKAGQYELSMQRYHGQPCIGPSVSSSGLRKILNESPADFWAFSDLNDERFDKEETDAFTFGRAAHALLLGDEDFNARFAVIPSSAPPQPMQSQILARAEGRVSKSAEERFAFWDDFYAENEGKTLISQGDLEHIGHISRALAAHPIVPLLLEGQAEQSLIWQDDKTGLWLKSRLDVLSGTGDFADLKSTSRNSLPLIYKDIREKGYDMQLGLATMAVENVLGIPFSQETYEGRSALNVFIYKSPPYHVIPVEVSYDALYWGRIKCRKAIDLMAECIDKGEWPGPVEGIPTYTPDYELAKLVEKQTSGELPLSA